MTDLSTPPANPVRWIARARCRHCGTVSGPVLCTVTAQLRFEALALACVETGREKEEVDVVRADAPDLGSRPV